MAIAFLPGYSVRVCVITRTSDEWAKNEWTRQIGAAGGEAVIISPETAVQYIGAAESLDSIALDDVNPANMQEAKLIIEVLLSSYPPVRSVVMVPDDLLQDVARLCHGNKQHVMLHPHSAPSGPMFEYLCHRICPDGYMSLMQELRYRMPIYA